MAFDLQRFVSELSRRRVMRVVATYAIGAFGALQSFDVIVSALGLPHGLMTGLVVLTFVGLPVTAILAWVFDITPDGVIRTAPLPEGVPGSIGIPTIPAPARSRLALVLGICAVMLGIAGASLWWSARHKAPLANDLVAVMPFTVGGSEQYRYLHDGLAELLSAGIGGGGALRTVDERALGRAIKEAGGDPDDEAGRALARKFGAGLVVVGNVLEVKDRLRIHAQLFNANDGDRPIADASAEGDAARLFAMVDDLLRQLRPGLLASGRAPASEPMVALAEGATTSLPALKAFIEGEGALREGDEHGALAALQKAVAEDPNFAVAQYRLAVVSSWTNEIPLGRAALYHALRGREKLPQRERDLIEAFAAYWRGHAKEAEQRYRAILDKNPDDAESWYQLGEVLFHDGPYQGRPEREARPLFERAAALEPNQRMYSIHLDEMSRLDGDRKALARLDELQLKSTPDSLPIRWERAWALGDEAQRLELEKKMIEAKDLLGAAGLTLNHSPDEEGLRIARAFVARADQVKDPSPDTKLNLELTQSASDFVAGQRQSSNTRLGHALVGHPEVLASTATRALVPFMPHEKAELTKALANISSESDMPYGIHSPVEARQVRAYLRGRLAAELGDGAAVQEAAQALASSNDSDDSALGPDLALSVRAHAAAAQGKGADALALLEQMSGGIPLAVVGTPYINGEGDRWLRAELLAQQGRYAEALRWFDSVETNSVGYWSAPLRLRRAEMLEHLGKKKEALDQYRVFAGLWRDCDPDLRPLVDNAQARLAALTRESPQ